MEQLSDDDLMKLIREEQEQAQAEAEGRPRDEQGRFVSEPVVAPEAEAPEPEPEPEAVVEPPTVYRRVIDLGDGSGTQVFEGATQEELIEKLATAQTNATRKIRELSQTNRQTQQEQADAEYLLSQEMLTRPSDAVKRIFEQTVGMPVEEFKTTVERVKAYERSQAAARSAAEFVTATPDYYDSPQNGGKIGRYLNRYGLEFTVENMKKAYAELSSDGLLVPKPKTDPAPAAPATPQRRSSGISSQRSAPVPAKKELTEDDLYKLPMEELEKLARQS